MWHLKYDFNDSIVEAVEGLFIEAFHSVLIDKNKADYAEKKKQA